MCAHATYQKFRVTTTEKPIAHEWVSTAYIVREGGAVVEWILDAGRSHDFHKARRPR